jgi:hypothetical protein
VGDQAETTVILSRDLSYNISVNLPRLVGLPTELYRGAQAQKEHGDGVCVSYADLAFALFHPFAQVNKFEDLLQRESQLLHKYDEQAAHPESFQRISNLSGIGTQVKWQSYLYKNVLKRVYVFEFKCI